MSDAQHGTTPEAATDAHMATPTIAALVGELQKVLAAPFTQVFLEDPRPA